MINFLSRILMVLGAIATFIGLLGVPGLFSEFTYSHGFAIAVETILRYAVGPLAAGIGMMVLGWRVFKSKKAQAEVQAKAQRAAESRPANVEAADANLVAPGSGSGAASDSLFKPGAGSGVIIMIIGALVAFSPLAIAIANTAPGHNWMSEGDSQSGGAAIWLMMFTLPVGAIIGIYGLVKLIQSATQSSTTTTSPEVADNLADPTLYKKQPTNGARTLGTVLAIAGGAYFGSQGLMQLVMMQWEPGMAIQGVIYLAIGAALAIFGIRLARGKRK
jgi:hypothetical protein